MSDVIRDLYHSVIEPRINELEDIHRRAGDPEEADRISAERSRFAGALTAEKDVAKEIEDAAGQRLCRRCGHTWRGRSPVRPTQCPKCRSYLWDRARD